MSLFMLNDSNSINDWNPYVVGDFNLPGTWSAPWPYSRDPPYKDPVDTAIEPSPECAIGATAALGSLLRGGLFCDPTYKTYPKVSCPMSRTLVPEQLFDPGMWTYQKSEKPMMMSMFQNNLLFWLSILVLVVLLYRSRA